ncbi:MAG: hypothetical protein Q7K03_03820 [Dehalococcoidia bacterium]|nr:hypothetical protein [Dehalococcoidia bacterium]
MEKDITDAELRKLEVEVDELARHMLERPATLTEALNAALEGFAEGTVLAKIERFHGTLKQRTKVMRGLKNRNPPS